MERLYVAGRILELTDVTFAYETATAPVFEGLTARFPEGWTGLIGANGTGKTTLLYLAAGRLTPARGQIHTPGRMIHCPQRTDDAPERLAAFIAARDHLACRLRGQLNVGDDRAVRWETSSHGERKRAQIAVALWCEPDVLAIDEPTNHIDDDARRQLGEALASFPGVGLLVSHDRALLDALCDRCFMLEPPSGVMRPGGYTAASEQAEAEAEHARQVYQQARQQTRQLEREASNRRREATRADRRRSKRGVSAKDSDARARIDLARVSGKDGQAGRRLRQMQGRVEQAREGMADLRVAKAQRLGITLRGERVRRDRLFRLAAAAVELGDGRRLLCPELTMAPGDRVAMVGPNGAGKSTLVRRIVSSLEIPAEKVVYLPQEIDRKRGRQIITEVQGLPRARRGDVMTAVRCLGSQPERLLETPEPSPGELRKVMLAFGLERAPNLIVMDEPTNHLDLPSIECLETALRDCECALLLISHDRRFLEALAPRWWCLSAGEDAKPGADVRLTEYGLHP